jgi:peptidoglycan L-alanyl-D-glutamate endopeptidase CwlK
MDLVSEQRLAQVHPLLAAKVRAMADALLAQDPPVLIRVTQGLRTWDEQDALYQQGRTKPGTIVTNAPAGFSYHNFGLAVDVVPMTPTGPDWDISHPVWQQIISAGRDVGLDAGALWRTFKDYPHFQLTGALPVSPDDAVRTLYTQNGMPAVWEATTLNV